MAQMAGRAWCSLSLTLSLCLSLAVSLSELALFFSQGPHSGDALQPRLPPSRVSGRAQGQRVVQIRQLLECVVQICRLAESVVQICQFWCGKDGTFVTRRLAGRA